MYLDNWMITMIVLAFGMCAFFSQKYGVRFGISRTLQILESEKIIRISDAGEVSRWAPYAEAPKKKKKV